MLYQFYSTCPAIFDLIVELEFKSSDIKDNIRTCCRRTHVEEEDGSVKSQGKSSLNETS